MLLLPARLQLRSHIVCWTVLASASAALAEAPQVTGLFPAGARQGETVTLTLIGKPGTAPLEAWCSSDDAVLHETDKSSEWTVSVARDAPPGLRWVRFYNADGATRRLPFVVGQIPEINEAEPNDAASPAHEIAELPAVVNGRLVKSGDVDTFAVPLEAGHTLVASVDAHRLLGSPMDPVLQLLSPRGFILEQNDDRQGNDPQITFTAQEGGTYFLRLFAFPADPNSTIGFAGAETYVYRLTLTTGPFIRHLQPLALSTQDPQAPRARGWNLAGNENAFASLRDGRATLDFHAPTSIVPERVPYVDFPVVKESDVRVGENAGLLSVPIAVSGAVGQPGEVDEFRFQGVKDQKIVLAAEATVFDSPLDPVLKVFGPDNAKLHEVDDESRGVSDARVAFKLPADGMYRVQVTDRFAHGDEWYVYLLTIDNERPSCSLKLPDDSLTVASGASLEVPVGIERVGGFDQEITLRMYGLPVGVRANEKVSFPGGKSAKEVKLTIQADSGVRFSGPIRVVGTTANGQTLPATTAAPSAGLRADSVWLTITGAAK